MRCRRPALWRFVDLRVSSWITLFSVAATPSRADAPAGSAGVSPAQHWQRFTHLLDRARPATAAGFRLGRARAIPAGGVARCRERGRLARTTLAKAHPSPRPSSTGNGATILLRPTHAVPAGRVTGLPHHGETERPPNTEDAGETPALPEGRLLPSLLPLQGAPPPITLAPPGGHAAACRAAGRADAVQVSRFVALRRPSCVFVDNSFFRSCDVVTGGRPRRERGRPARTTLAKAHPSPRPSSTGNGAGAPLQPGPCGFRRRGGRLPYRRETERPPNAEDAGETPALPEGAPPPFALTPPGGVSSHHSCPSRG